MKYIAIITLLIYYFSPANCQSRNCTPDEIKIHQAIQTFMHCLVEKDSNLFFSLFHQEPVVWVGVFKERAQQKRLQQDSTKLNYFTSTYKKFYRTISNEGTNEEKFNNIKINTDGSIAAVTFDYSFWEKGQKINYGKESWGMVNLNEQWKITSVLFSMDFTADNSLPKKKK